MKLSEQRLREIVREQLISLEEAKGFKNTTDFEKFLIEIDGMGDSQIKKIMGKDYIDTPGFYQDEKADYDDVEDFMRSNMGDSEFEELESWWENNVAESVVTEGAPKMAKNVEAENIQDLMNRVANAQKGGGSGRYGKEFDKAKTKALRAIKDMVTYSQIGR